MALIGQELGNYDSSLRLYQAALGLFKRLYGPENIHVATCLHNIASVYQQQGDYAEALAFYNRSLVLKRKYLGSEHSEIGGALNNLGSVYSQQGKYAAAIEHYQSALGVYAKAYGADHPDTAVALNNLALVYGHQEKYSNALIVLQRSLRISQTLFGMDHPRVASILHNIAATYDLQGEDAEALKIYNQSLNMTERFLGHYHPKVAAILQNIVANNLKRKDLALAIVNEAETLRRQRPYFRLQYWDAQHQDALRMMYLNRFATELFHSLCGEVDASRLEVPKYLGAAQLVLNKALLEEIRTTQSALEVEAEGDMRGLRQEHQLALINLANLAEKKFSPVELVKRRHYIEEKLRNLEVKLAERTELTSQTITQRDLTFVEVSQYIPVQACLVDLVRYMRFDYTVKTNEWKETRYAAYLTFPPVKNSTNVVVERVDLGEAAPIDQAVQLICRRMGAGQYRAQDLTAALRRLTELVYMPMARHLTNVSHLIICPDGQLSRVPFEMLPLPPFDSQSRYLVQEKTISYVGSGREIARLAQPGTKPKTNAAVVMGNPDFDLDIKTKAEQAANSSGTNRGNRQEETPYSILGAEEASLLALPAMRRAPTLSRAYGGLRFTPLRGAEEEAKSAATLLGPDCLLRVGKDAREAELKALVSPRVLHLATHGFFLSDQEFLRINTGLDLLPIGNVSARRMPGQNDWENPMIRCGLALAGANHARQITNAIAEDGLLTGMEAALLNLQGTELVILSACDSGSGEVQIGEGVMSLRRAFRIAGAESVLASHWKVNDKATSLLMTEFMRRWRSGEPRGKAWREAQLSLLQSKDFSNPFFWAAFTLTGQWR